jgi:hypothetical protein
MSMFLHVLLNSSRVVWPAEGPAPMREVITLHPESRLELAHMYLSLTAYPDRGDAAVRFLAALADLIALKVIRHTGSAAGLPPELRHPPRAREVESALKPGLRRLRRALEVAHRFVDHEGDVEHLARVMAAKLVGGFGGAPRPARKIRRREVEPMLATAHLAMPVVARWRQPPAFLERYPELAPAAIRPSLAELIEDGSWVYAALHAAEDWRRLTPEPWRLIEVRAARYLP